MIKHNFCANTTANILVALRHFFNWCIVPQRVLLSLINHFCDKSQTRNGINRKNYKRVCLSLVAFILLFCIMIFISLEELSIIGAFLLYPFVHGGLSYLLLGGLEFSAIVPAGVLGFFVGATILIGGMFLFAIIIALILTSIISGIKFITQPIWKPIYHGIRRYFVNVKDALTQIKLTERK